MAEAEKVDAWMPLWIGSYLADTMKLTTLQHGAYLLLLIAYWRNRGPLEDLDDDLASTVKADAKTWASLRPKLERFFTIEDGVWRHGRADQELAKAVEHKVAASARGKKGAKSRWAKPEQSASSASSSAAGNAPSMHQAFPKHQPSNARALLDQCPTPSPTPTPSGFSVPVGTADPPVDNSLRSEPDPVVPGMEWVWHTALRILGDVGIAEPAAREFMGCLSADWGNPVVVEAVKACLEQHPVDPKAWLVKACRVRAARLIAGSSAYESAEETRARQEADDEAWASQDEAEAEVGRAAARATAARLRGESQEAA